MKRQLLQAILGLGMLSAVLLASAPVVAETIESGWPVMKPGKTDRCPVCGMFPQKYPKWMAGFTFHSGARYFHCSPKCMLHNLLNVPKYQPGEKRDHIKRIWVTEYYTTKQMDAHQALFVVGSKVVGPMGLDLIPVHGKDAAENLKRDYQGALVVTLEQITSDIVQKARRGKLNQTDLPPK